MAAISPAVRKGSYKWIGWWRCHFKGSCLHCYFTFLSKGSGTCKPSLQWDGSKWGNERSACEETDEEPQGGQRCHLLTQYNRERAGGRRSGRFYPSALCLPQLVQMSCLTSEDTGTGFLVDAQEKKITAIMKDTDWLVTWGKKIQITQKPAPDVKILFKTNTLSIATFSVRQQQATSSKVRNRGVKEGNSQWCIQFCLPDNFSPYLAP